MGEAEQQILQMLENGQISVEEAQKLLAAMKPEEALETVSDDSFPETEPAEKAFNEPPPQLDRFRRLWVIPLFIAAGSLLLSGFGLYLMYRSTENVALFGFICIWSIFLLAFFLTIILLLARRSTWLYLRVEEKDGSRFALGLPMPLGLVGWAVRIARPFVPQDQALHLETAAAFVSAMKDSPEKDPIIIDVDDDDGDKVQIFIG